MNAASSSAQGHATLPAQHTREYAFSDRCFTRLRELVMRHTGIRLTEAKRDMVYGRLARRLRALGLRDFDDYCALIEEQGNDELEPFVNAITTNLTSFFRERHHFEFLAETALPEIMEARHIERRIRVWSAGCSTGEEPYSIAMVLREALSDALGWDARILATDLDSGVLERAARGVYERERVAGLSEQRLRHCFLKGQGRHEGKVRITPELREMVRFHRLNLMDEWPMYGLFDIIFCRNVVIYFDKPTQCRLFDRFADRLATDGFLFVGHSESLFRVTERFRLIGQSMYRKLS